MGIRAKILTLLLSAVLLFAPQHGGNSKIGGNATFRTGKASPRVAGSLLKGCTVSATNTVRSCASSFPPAGWKLKYAQGFEGTVAETTIGKIDSTIVHAGSKALNTTCTGDQCTVALFYTVGALNDVYLSQWRYEAVGATYGQDHFVYQIFSTNAGGTGIQQLILNLNSDWAQPNYITRYGPLLVQAQPANINNPTYRNYENGFDWGHAVGWTLPTGSWHQYEWWVHTSTTCTGASDNPSDHISPGDGFYRAYIDGQLVMSGDNLNLTNCNSFRQNPNLVVEPAMLLSTFYYANAGGQCLPAGDPGAVTFPAATLWATAPKFQIDGIHACWGSQPNFKVALDDIIVIMK